MYVGKGSGFFLIICLITIFSKSAFAAHLITFDDKPFGVQVTSNVVYDGVNALLLDIYEPTGVGVPVLKPAFVMGHGGAWAAGSKDSSTFENPAQTGDFNTPMKDYAREFAKRGYVCVSINYRHVQDGPISTGFLSAGDFTSLGVTLTDLYSSPISAALAQMIVETAVEDTMTAIDWLAANAGTYGIDPTRIAVGGYSAGAINALFAGHTLAGVTSGAATNIAAVWANSGNLFGNGNEPVFVTASGPPTIVFQGTLDPLVDYSTAGVALRDALINDGVPHEYYTMTGEDHWYLINKVLTDAPLKAVPDTIENLLSDFMFTQMNLGALPTPATPDLPNAGSLTLCLTALALTLSGMFAVRCSWRRRG